MTKSKTKKARRNAGAVKADTRASRTSHEPAVQPAEVVPSAAAELSEATKPTALSPEPAVLPVLGFNYGGTLLRKSLRLFKQNFESSIIIFVLPALALSLGSLLIGDGKQTTTISQVGSLITVVSFIWYIVSSFAGLPFGLAIARGQQPSIFAMYQRGLQCIPKLLGLTMLVFPLVVLGTILGIIPGLLVLRRYFVSCYYVIDLNFGIRDAMDAASRDSKLESRAVYSALLLFGIFIALSTGFGRTFSPYGPILSIVVQSLFLFAPPLLYLELKKRATLRFAASEGQLQAADDSIDGLAIKN